VVTTDVGANAEPAGMILCALKVNVFAHPIARGDLAEKMVAVDCVELVIREWNVLRDFAWTRAAAVVLWDPKAHVWAQPWSSVEATIS